MLHIRKAMLRSVQRRSSVFSRFFSGLPDHIVVPMPALSPTMETGSIANWLLKEGDAFEAGQAICEVETDKATVTYDATDDGYIAKILVGSGDIEVGVPLMVTVEDSADVASFANYSASATSTTVPSAIHTDEIVHTPLPTVSSVPLSAAGSGERVVASPLARRLAREAGLELSLAGQGSGYRGRLVAADVAQAVARQGQTENVQEATPVQHAPSPSIVAATPQKVASVSSLMGALHSQSKKEVPHYYLSVEIDVSKAMSLKESLGVECAISVQDILVKAAAKAMEKVPAVNAAWMDSFVRQYDQVDINLVVGEGSTLRAPLLRDVGSRGLSSLSREIKEACEQPGDEGAAPSTLEPGTFTIHNLGMYGVQSVAAIVLLPQACALSLGAVVDTVVPNPSAQAGEEEWKVAPMLVATLSCDHRVIDGAVGAGWLKVFKQLVENPMTLLL